MIETQSSTVLLISQDPVLREDVERVAITAGVSIACVDRVPPAADWCAAGLVLLDPRCRAGVDDVPTRSGVVVVCGRDTAGAAAGEGAWDVALAVAAEHVAVLPEATTWLAGRVSTAESGYAPSCRLIAVVGGSGGAGASVLATALAVTASRGGAALLLDVDPLGGGLDLALGAEDTGGSRWPALAAVTGPLAPDALSGTLPVVDGLTVLSCERGELLDLPPAAVAAVVAAACRGHDVVVADLPRRADPAAREVARRADRVVVVVVGTLRGVAAAARVTAQYRRDTTHLAVVVRQVPRALHPEEVADALGLPLAGVIATDRGLAADLEAGVAPGTRARGGLSRTAGRLLADLS